MSRSNATTGENKPSNLQNDGFNDEKKRTDIIRFDGENESNGEIKSNIIKPFINANIPHTTLSTTDTGSAIASITAADATSGCSNVNAVKDGLKGGG